MPIQTPDVYAVLDFETTGLNPKFGDRAIEIGIVLIDSEGTEIDTFSSLINPGTRVSSFITGFTGISNQMLATAPSAHEVMPRVLEFVGTAQLVAHNANFDKKFWRHEVKYTTGVDDEQDFVCTLMLSRRIFQMFQSHRLSEIARELGIEVVDSHRALADSQVTAQILSVMLERLRSAHEGKAIDTKFLRTYQRKARTNLPDLSVPA